MYSFIPFDYDIGMGLFAVFLFTIICVLALALTVEMYRDGEYIPTSICGTLLMLCIAFTNLLLYVIDRHGYNQHPETQPTVTGRLIGYKTANAKVIANDNGTYGEVRFAVIDVENQVVMLPSASDVPEIVTLYKKD